MTGEKIKQRREMIDALTDALIDGIARGEARQLATRYVDDAITLGLVWNHDDRPAPRGDL